jgi:hypothetical protein
MSREQSVWGPKLLVDVVYDVHVLSYDVFSMAECGNLTIQVT